MNAWESDPKFRGQFQAALLGLRCTKVEKYAPDSWRFEFESRTFVDVHCCWRIISAGAIAFGDGDHEQQFGLTAPIDGEREAMRLLTGTVDSVLIRDATADLVLSFSNATLEILSDSSGYEAWTCSSTNGLLTVAQGCGSLVTWSART